jgi:hypothetical protein
VGDAVGEGTAVGAVGGEGFLAVAGLVEREAGADATRRRDAAIWIACRRVMAMEILLKPSSLCFLMSHLLHWRTPYY